MRAFLYGIVVLVALYYILRMMYSVYYTPGTTTIYNSPVAQKLFPNAMNKLFPTWGYNKLGMYDGQPFKFGAGGFWPSAGRGYVPNKFGSPGASPEGGMRPSFEIPAETAVGFWGRSVEPQTNTVRDIYDSSSQHVEYETSVGWWGA
jgi:hypothetical protein